MHRPLNIIELNILAAVLELQNANRAPTHKRLSRHAKLCKVPIIESLDLLKNIYGYLVNPSVDNEVQQDVLYLTPEGREVLKLWDNGNGPYQVSGFRASKTADDRLSHAVMQPTNVADDQDDDDDAPLGGGEALTIEGGPRAPAPNDEEREGTVDDGQGPKTLAEVEAAKAEQARLAKAARQPTAPSRQPAPSPTTRPTHATGGGKRARRG